MKFKIVRSKFIEALKAVQNVVAGKGTLAILQNVLIEVKNGEMKMMTTDLDISVRTKTQCEVITEGATTLPVKYLFSAISKVVEGEVEVSVEENEKATIIAGNASYRLVGMPEREFPTLPEEENAYEYKVEQATFKEMLRKVSYAASQDDTRRTLKGVLVSFKDEKLTMVATDGRRLALTETEMEFPKESERDIVLPSKTVNELQRLLIEEGELTIRVQKTQICFSVENMQIYSKLIDDTYPNYRQVIPKEIKERITVDRQLLYDAIERANVMTMNETHSTKLIFESGKLTVMAAVSDLGEAKDVVPIKYAGEKIEIMFNPNYVMDPLRAIDDDEITINLKDGHSPAIIKCSIPFIYVLMPLRIS